MASSKPSSPTTANPGYPNTLEKQDLDLKSHLMIMIEDFKKDVNKEIQENTGKQQEALKAEAQTFFNELPELGTLAHTFNPSTREAEAGRFLSLRPAWSTK